MEPPERSFSLIMSQITRVGRFLRLRIITRLITALELSLILLYNYLTFRFL